MSKKNKIMLIGIIVLAIAVIGTTFASWLINAKQTNYNVIKSGCVSITFSSGSGTISMSNASPVPDGTGINNQGYTFTLTNNCRQEVGYLLNLDLFNVNGSTNLTTDEIKLAVDNKVPRKVTYYDSTTVNDPDAYGAKTLTSGKIPGKTSETHTVKMWVDESSTTQNAVFSNRLFVKAGPDLTVPEIPSDDCFIVDNTGKILMYKTALCPSDLIVPNQINGVTVTGVAPLAFVDANALSVYDSGNDHLDFVILDEEHYDELEHIIDTLASTDIDWGVFTGTYDIYKASEYTNWSNFTSERYNNIINSAIQDDIIGSSTGINSFRYNIPLDLDVDGYNNEWGGFVSTVFTTSPYDGNSLMSVPDDASYSSYTNGPTKYLKSIDFSRCTSISSIDTEAVVYNKDLTSIELPNNSNFVINDSSFDNNYLSKVFIPTYTSAIHSYAFSNNNLTYLELYSTNNLALYDSSFGDNNISRLVVNSTIDVSNVNTYKPFNNNPSSLASNIIIGHNSTNTASDFY